VGAAFDYPDASPRDVSETNVEAAHDVVEGEVCPLWHFLLDCPVEQIGQVKALTVGTPQGFVGISCDH